MAETQTTETPTLNEQEQLYDWRHDRICELGIDPHIAQLAALCDVDWHTLDTMIRNGCPPHTAIRILA